MLSPGGAGGVSGTLSRPAKDPNWLTLEVCREYARNKCTRAEEECKFAHPPPHIDIQNGRVTCCFDSLQGRCQRVDPPCKYFHPPEHLKDQLSHSRRSYPTVGVHYQPLTQQSSSMLSGTAPLPFVSPFAQSFLNHGMNPYLLQSAVGAFSPFLAQALTSQHGYSELAAVGGGECGNATSNPLAVMVSASPAYTQAPRLGHRSDRMEVCREYQRGVCTRSPSECRYAHPPNGMSVDADNYVTVCMDFIKGRCHREICRYFHPPPHLQAQVKSSQQRALGLRPSPAALALGGGGQLVSATLPSAVMPRMTVASTSPYAALLAPSTGAMSTVAPSVSSYQQQAAVLAALQLQQQSLLNLSLCDRQPPPSSDADRY